MTAVIEQGIITGIIQAPPSKSMTQRAYAAALLHTGLTTISNWGRSDDEQAALGVIQQLGARVVSANDRKIIIEGKGVYGAADTINCGESGLAARLFSPIATLADRPVTVVGNGSLLTRPMDGFAAAFEALGITTTGFNGFLPLTLYGPLQPRNITIDGSMGSQFLSGLLFAFTAVAHEPVVITVKGLKSKPYTDMTLDMLALFGRPVKHKDYKEFYIDPALFVHSENVAVDIEADWSSASFSLVAGAIAGRITVQHLNVASRQADRAILDVLQQAGAVVELTNSEIKVQTARLQAFEFDATHCPDLFPILSILGACCDGESSIKGLHRLFHKESNRVESITEMLHDFGVPFSAEDDTLFITGIDHLQGTVVDSYNDHRIVMAAAIGALRARGPVGISDPEVVNKSYPGFFQDLMKFGGKCTFNR